jgi:hypothetical protein
MFCVREYFYFSHEKIKVFLIFQQLGRIWRSSVRRPSLSVWLQKHFTLTLLLKKGSHLSNITTLSHTHTHKHTLFWTHPHTHTPPSTHAHTLSNTPTFFLFWLHSHTCAHLLLFYTDTHRHTHSLSNTLTHTLSALTDVLHLLFFHTDRHTHTHILTDAHSLSLPLSQTHTHSLSHTHNTQILSVRFQFLWLDP